MAKVIDRMPGIEQINGEDSGWMLPGANWLFLMHTGETRSMSGLIDTLRRRRAWSHLIGDTDTGEMVQALSFNRAGRSLKSGGNFGKTNAARVIQIELTGFATETPFWTPEKNRRVGQMIARVAQHVPFELAFPLPFYGDRDGFIVASASARQRMTWAQWYRFNAICGHQHAPRNDHWDPGHINTREIAAGFGISRPVVAAAPAYTPPRFPGYTLRRGQVSQDVAVLKLMMNMAEVGPHSDLSTIKKAQTFGAGTAYDVAHHLAPLYYKSKGRELPKNPPEAVGPELWKFLGALLVLKHAIEQQAKK